jgi:hypothetical protein
MATTTQHVRVFGPNLRDQSKGTFHVHAEGCADNRHYGPGKRYGGDDYDGWLMEAASHDDVGDSIYEDHIAEGSMEPGEGKHDCHFFPCVKMGVTL